MTTTNAPVAGSGPDATLNLTDPTTWVMILSAVGAVAVKAVPAIAGWGVDQLYPAFALLAAALVIGWGLYSKHRLAAAVATVLPPLEAVGLQVADTVAPGALDALRADLAGLKAQVDAIPADQRQAALDALSGLISQAHPAP